MIKIKFSNVGRYRLCWEAELSALSSARIIKAIRSKKALVSRFIEIEMKPDLSGGSLFVGDRSVGTFTVEGKNPPKS